MPSPIDREHREETPVRAPAPKLTAGQFALALLAASSLQIMENLIPRFPLFPWLRVGLSYVIILPFLLQFGPRAAFALVLGRNLVAVLYGGQPFSTFLISSSSGVVAFLGLGWPVRWLYARRLLGLSGAGVLLATVFNITQLVLVECVLIRHAGFFFQIGPILAWSALSGVAVAAFIRYAEGDLLAWFQRTARETSMTAPRMRRNDTRLFAAGLAALGAVLLLPFLSLQIAALLIVLFASRGQSKILFSAWPFFFYLAWLHLFHTAGEYWIGDWVTRQGVAAFCFYTVRLANLILLGRWISGRFPWHWGERSGSVYAQGFLLSLPLMTDIFESSLRLGREMGRRLWSGNRRGALTPAFDAWQAKVETGSEAPSVFGGAAAPITN